jgi:ferredoxin
MATFITTSCINCGACLPECPNEAISEGDDIYVIDPSRCTECVGHHEREACQAVCPIECCLPDPARPETEAMLLERATKLHPERVFPSLQLLPPELSRFRTPQSS